MSQLGGFLILAHCVDGYFLSHFITTINCWLLHDRFLILDYVLNHFYIVHSKEYQDFLRGDPKLMELKGLGSSHSLKEKRVLKRCLWGTILENGAFFGKKGTVWENSALSESGTKAVPQKVPFYGRPNGAPRAPFWCHLFFWVLSWLSWLPSYFQWYTEQISTLDVVAKYALVRSQSHTDETNYITST